jgi:hypothetical protein
MKYVVLTSSSYCLHLAFESASSFNLFFFIKDVMLQ